MIHHAAMISAILLATLPRGCSDLRRGSRTAAPAAAEPLPSMLSSSAVAPFCSDTSETVAVKCGEGAVTRRGDTLVIALSGIGVVKRVSDSTDGGHYVRYQYAGRMGGGGSGTPAYHVVDVAHYEAAGIELINAASGDSVLIGGPPILSPDGSRFATTSENAESCEATNQLDIWRITGDKPVREFELPPFDCTRTHSWWPSAISWRASDTVTFLRNSLPADSARRARSESDTTRAVLVHRAEGWFLEPRASQPPRAR